MTSKGTSEYVEPSKININIFVLICKSLKGREIFTYELRSNLTRMWMCYFECYNPHHLTRHHLSLGCCCSGKRFAKTTAICFRLVPAHNCLRTSKIYLVQMPASSLTPLHDYCKYEATPSSHVLSSSAAAVHGTTR